jgi:hypothetical protein
MEKHGPNTYISSDNLEGYHYSFPPMTYYKPGIKDELHKIEDDLDPVKKDVNTTSEKLVEALTTDIVAQAEEYLKMHLAFLEYLDGRDENGAPHQSVATVEQRIGGIGVASAKKAA